MCLFFTHIAVEIKGSDYIWGYSGAAKCNTNLFTDVNPNRWGEPMSRPQRGREPPPFRAGRRSELKYFRNKFLETSDQARGSGV